MTDPLQKRKRGRTPDPEKTGQTRAAILEAALQSFLEHGFAGTRMADVAARAGLAKGTLYLHFADKEALFAFVLEQLFSVPLARRLQEAADAGSPRQMLERVFLPLLRDLETSGRASVVRLILAEANRFPALSALHRERVIDPFLAAVRAAAERAAVEPLVRYPQLVAAPLVMTVVWNGLWSADQLNPADVFTAFLDLAFPKPK